MDGTEGSRVELTRLLLIDLLDLKEINFDDFLIVFALFWSSGLGPISAPSRAPPTHPAATIPPTTATPAPAGRRGGKEYQSAGEQWTATADDTNSEDPRS